MRRAVYRSPPAVESFSRALNARGWETDKGVPTVMIDQWLLGVACQSKSPKGTHFRKSPYCFYEIALKSESPLSKVKVKRE